MESISSDVEDTDHKELEMVVLGDDGRDILN